MSELKTFKDFMYDEYRYKIGDTTKTLSRSTRMWHISANNNLKRMKKEAIKWIKNLQGSDTEYPLVLENIPDTMKGSAIKPLWYNTEFRLGTEYGMIAWIMNFFNITEEELK